MKFMKLVGRSNRKQNIKPNNKNKVIVFMATYWRNRDFKGQRASLSAVYCLEGIDLPFQDLDVLHYKYCTCHLLNDFHFLWKT